MLALNNAGQPEFRAGLAASLSANEKVTTREYQIKAVFLLNFLHSQNGPKMIAPIPSRSASSGAIRLAHTLRKRVHDREIEREKDRGHGIDRCVRRATVPAHFHQRSQGQRASDLNCFNS